MSDHNCYDHYSINGHCRICGAVKLEAPSELAPATGSAALQLQITQLMNAAAIVVSHEATIRRYAGGAATSAVALLKSELELTAKMMKQNVSDKCDLGNGEWDHDWQEKHDDAGEVDGIPGDHWSWRECRVCGAIEGETPKQNTELSGSSPLG